MKPRAERLRESLKGVEFSLEWYAKRSQYFTDKLADKRHLKDGRRPRWIRELNAVRDQIDRLRVNKRNIETQLEELRRP